MGYLSRRGWRTTVPHPRNLHKIHVVSSHCPQGHTQVGLSHDAEARDGGGQRSTAGTLEKKLVRDRGQATT